MTILKLMHSQKIIRFKYKNQRFNVLGKLRYKYFRGLVRTSIICLEKLMLYAERLENGLLTDSFDTSSILILG